jgi:uncharacterized protein (DUF934 family)
MPLIKDGKIVQDPWTEAAAGGPLPEVDALLVPYEVWKEERETLMKRNGRLGVRLAADQPPQLIAGDLDRLDLVALEFPTFRDGRAYSYARLLRERYGYKKELRAVGNVLRDQFLFMHRCGIDAYAVADEKAAADWTRALKEISVVYQPATDRRRSIPALRHRAPVGRNNRPSPSSSDDVVSSWAY